MTHSRRARREVHSPAPSKVGALSILYAGWSKFGRKRYVQHVGSYFDGVGSRGARTSVRLTKVGVCPDLAFELVLYK
jgi:hypothetical protein